MGNTGADKFVFNTALIATTNKDTILDFVSGTDKIWLDDDIFTALGPVVTTTNFTSAKFFAGTAAHDSDDRIIYVQGTGALYYDADGLGGSTKVRFATLGTTTHPALAYSDIQIVA